MSMKAVVVAAALCVASAQFDLKKEAPAQYKKGVEAPEAKYHEHGSVDVEVAPVPYCKDGSEYGPQGCAYTETADLEFECPKPYKLDKKSGQCLTKTYGESSTVCPKGSELDHKKCVVEIVEQPEEVCDKGELTKGGCLVRGEGKAVAPKYKDLKYECPKGYKLDGHECYQSNYEQADLVCEKGFELEGKKCVSVETAPLECDKGQMTKGGCIETDVAEVEQYCPHGSKESGKGCYETVEEKATAVCEKGYELDKHGKCTTDVLIQAMPTKKGTPAHFKCMGTQDEKGNCFQTHKADATYVCEKGFEQKGKKCYSTIPVQPEFECPKGYEAAATGTKADCVKTKVYKPKCPKGFKQSDKGTCVRYITEKPASVCPKGTDFAHGKCESVESVPATPYCPKDYDLVKDGCVLPGYAIPGEDKTYKPKVVCPKDFKLDKKENVCLSYDFSVPTVVCEKGYDLVDGKKCIANHAVAPQAICPKGFVSGDSKTPCTKTHFEHPHFECPKGSEDKGKKCYISQDQPKLNLAPYPAPQATKKNY